MDKNIFSSRSESCFNDSQLRIFTLSSIPFFVIWGIVINHTRPELYDPFWIRGVLGVLGVLGVFASYFVKNPKRFLYYGLLFSAYIITMHSYYLLVRNDFTGFSGSVIVTGLVIQALPSKKTLRFFLALNAIFIGSSLFFGWGTFEKQVIFVISIFGIMVPSYLFKNYSLKAIEQIKSSELEKGTILQNMSDGLVLHDKNGKITSANTAAYKILELSKEQLMDENARIQKWDIIDENGKILTENETAPYQVIENKIPRTNVSVGIREKQTGKIRWLNLTSTPLFEKSIFQGVLTCFQDVTDLKKAQEQIIASQMNMITTARLNSLGEMASGIAHEVNNPLAIIQGKIYQISKLLKQSSEFPLVEEHLEKIEKTVFRIQKIVQGLRTFSRQADKDPFETYSLKTIIDETLGLCNQKLSQSQVVVTVDLEPDLKLDCRPGQISQILMNLLQNATDAVSQSSAKRIQIKAFRQKENIVISVSDSGTGIPSDIREKVMQPFFTTKEVGKGTGLGLSISLGIARQHSGNLYLDPSSEKTCFVLELPVEQNKNIDDFQVA